MRPQFFALCLSLTLLGPAARAAEAPRLLPAPTQDNPLAAGPTQTAILAGGCYWGMQAVFEHVKGVQRVVAGFTGKRATDEQDDLIRRAPPAESVEITFDPAQISYGQILRIFFSVAHDPTQVNRQLPDIGPQYRSVVFYSDDAQDKIATAYVAQLSAAHVFQDDIATQIQRLTHFHKVPDAQQDFGAKHPDMPYIVQVDEPRIRALKAIFPAYFLDTPLSYSD